MCSVGKNTESLCFKNRLDKLYKYRIDYFAVSLNVNYFCHTLVFALVLCKIFVKRWNIKLTLLGILGVLHLGHALQALGNLMETTHAAVQLQTGLLAGLVKEVLTDGPAGVI